MNLKYEYYDKEKTYRAPKNIDQERFEEFVGLLKDTTVGQKLKMLTTAK